MKRKGTSAQRFPRTARVNELVMEIVGDELERLSDPRVQLVTVTGAEVNADLTRATVYYSSIDAHGRTPTPEQAEATAAALDGAAPHVRAALGRQVRWRSTPALVFKPDPAIEQGRRIEEILRDLHAREAGPGEGDVTAVADAADAADAGSTADGDAALD